MNNKNIEIYYVYNSEIFDNISKIDYDNKNNNNITKTFVSRANLYNSCNAMNGIVIGNSTNNFDIVNKKVYVIRQDSLYIEGSGDLIFNFNFTQSFDNIDELPIRNNLNKFVAKPTYASGNYLNKNVEISLDIFDTFRVYTISY